MIGHTLKPRMSTILQAVRRMRRSPSHRAWKCESSTSRSISSRKLRRSCAIQTWGAQAAVSVPLAGAHSDELADGNHRLLDFARPWAAVIEADEVPIGRFRDREHVARPDGDALLE